jgi:hypothetical protein
MQRQSAPLGLDGLRQLLQAHVQRVDELHDGRPRRVGAAVLDLRGRVPTRPALRPVDQLRKLV